MDYRGLSVGYSSHGVPMDVHSEDFPWAVRELLSAGCPWTVRGLPVTYSWAARGLYFPSEANYQHKFCGHNVTTQIYDIVLQKGE